MYHALKGHRKSGHTMELVGCSVSELATHLEKQFAEKMTWENKGEWHIDHRRPCASFDLSDAEQQKMCFHFTNCQPMWGSENMSKNDSYDEATFTHVWTGAEWVLRK